MNLRLVYALILLLLAANVVFADDDPTTPWPIDERCIGYPIQPPDGWTYPGTLLMSGYAGIHAMQADWETPRVVAFFDSGELGEPLEGGQLSPDGSWYAVPIGETWVEPSLNQYWLTNGLRIYSTVDDTVLNFDLSEYDDLLDYSRAGFYGTAWTYQAVRWLNNDELFIGSFLFNPFREAGIDVEVAPIPVALSLGIDFEASPDWTRVYSFIVSGERGEGLFDPEHPDKAIAYLKTEAVAWLHDSSGFIGEQQVEAEEWLSLFDRNGEFIERLFISEGGRLDVHRLVAGRNELGWSPDNRYFAFVHYPPQSQPSQLMIADRQNRVVVNTCLRPASQPTWSPDGSQLAVLLRADENLRVTILDLNTWIAYDVARHSGIGGALQPDMIAWRSDE